MYQGHANQPLSSQNFSLKRSLQAGLTFLLLLLKWIRLPAAAQFTAPVLTPDPSSTSQAPGARTTPPLSQTTVYVNPATGTDTAAGRAVALLSHYHLRTSKPNQGP